MNRYCKTVSENWHKIELPKHVSEIGLKNRFESKKLETIHE